MTTTSESKSRFERILSEIYARRLRENNKRVCTDQIKISLSVKMWLH